MSTATEPRTTKNHREPPTNGVEIAIQELTETGVCYYNGTRYAIQATDAGGFIVQTTTDGKRAESPREYAGREGARDYARQLMAAATVTARQQALRDALENVGHGGTESYYRHTVPGVFITDGAREVAEICGAWWFLDVIASWQLEPEKIPDTDFQVWKIELTPEGGAKIICGDGNSDNRELQAVEYTDFPLPEGISLWALPTETAEGRRVIIIMHPREH